MVLFSRRTDVVRWRAERPGGRLEPPGTRCPPAPAGLGAGSSPRVARRLRCRRPPRAPLHDARRSSVPAVVTIHDLSFFEQADWHEWSKVLLFRRAIKVAARRAAAVVCPSQVTAGQLARWCEVEAEVFVAHHGVDTGRFRPDEPEPGSDAAALAALDPRLTAGRPYRCSSEPSNRARTSPRWWARSPASPAVIPRPCWCWPEVPAGVPPPSTGPSRPRGCPPASCGPGTCPMTAVPPSSARRRRRLPGPL